MEKNPTLTIVVAAALSDGRGRWLMHRRPLHKHHGGLWEFPGGKIEPTEIPVNALARELQEELGISANPATFEPAGFAEGSAGTGSAQIVILLYTLRSWLGEPVAIEGEGIGWFEPFELLSLDMPPLDVTLARNLFAREGG